jgi:hypothetical protein
MAPTRWAVRRNGNAIATWNAYPASIDAFPAGRAHFRPEAPRGAGRSRGAGRPAATSRAGRTGKIKKIISLDSKKNFIWRFACKLVVFTALTVEKKMSSMKSRKAATARICRAVTGFAIPLLAIPQLDKLLEQAIATGSTDEELKAIVAAYPGVEDRR